jgi:outer membrane protein TolC
MFGFNKLKMKKEELEQQNAQLMEMVSRLNEDKKNLMKDMEDAINRVKALSSTVSSLEDELTLLRLRVQGKKYSDESRYY